MSYRSCELDVSSTLAPDLRSRDFYATSFTDYTFVSDALILTTCTLIVLAWAKDLFTEESSTFWALGSVVDRLRDEDFTIRECTDVFFGSESYRNRTEIVEIFPDSDISASCVFSDLGVVGDLVIEEIFKIFCHWKHRRNFLGIRIYGLDVCHFERRR